MFRNTLICSSLWCKNRYTGFIIDHESYDLCIERHMYLYRRSDNDND